MKLLAALPSAKPAVISIVGAGGKTSLAFALAREHAGQGSRVLITTTTAMFHPDQVVRMGSVPCPFDRFFLGPAREIPGAMPGEILLAARSRKGPKIRGYDSGDLAGAMSRFDTVIVEADGARMKPLKAPAAHEPVVLPGTRTLIACMGLDCLGHPVNASRVHRPEIVAGIMGTGPADPVTPADLIRLAADTRGSFKGAGRDMARVLVLNKADSKGLIKQGRDISMMVKDQVPGLGACLVTCLKDFNDPVKAGWSGRIL